MFDPDTLLLLSTIIAATLGALLLFAWAQNPSHRALAIWAGADFLDALGLGLLLTRNVAPDVVSVWLAFTAVGLGYAVVWAGARVFSDRPVRLGAMLAGPAVWTAACLVPAFFNCSQARVVLISAIAVLYSLATARELWADRGEGLMSRYPLIASLCLHAALLAARSVVAIAWTLPQSSRILQTPWLMPMAIEPIVLLILTGFLQISMAKERAEQVHRRVAATDALTGVASRRAFLAEGEQRLARARKQGQAVALLLFDIDRFKQVNDSHGHRAGDRLLQTFAAQVSDVLRRGDLFGRIGGEEFAALLINASLESAVAVAERCRVAMEKMTFEHDDATIQATVSVGVATMAASGPDLETMLGLADHALYDAKSAGRNCVQALKPAPTTLQLVA